jgi:hypothetical protein
MSLEKLPIDLLLNVFERQNLHEIRGLSSTNKTFREYCNHFARKQIQNLGTDYYELYVRLSQFYITVHTYEGNTRFAKCHKDKIQNTVQILLRSMNIQHAKCDISYQLSDERHPDQVLISFEHYDDLADSYFSVTIQGPFTNRKHAEQVINQISDVWDSLTPDNFFVW